MDKKPAPVEPVKETPEAFEIRRSISESQYERDEAWWRARNDERRESGPLGGWW